MYFTKFGSLKIRGIYIIENLFNLRLTIFNVLDLPTSIF